MTRNDRLAAFCMRLDGAAWEEIGQELGYAPKTVRDDLHRCITAMPKRPNIRYEGLRRYVEEHCGGSVRQLARLCGVKEASLYYSLSAGTPSESTVRAILSATGKPYKELFDDAEHSL